MPVPVIDLALLLEIAFLTLQQARRADDRADDPSDASLPRSKRTRRPAPAGPVRFAILRVEEHDLDELVLLAEPRIQFRPGRARPPRVTVSRHELLKPRHILSPENEIDVRV